MSVESDIKTHVVYVTGFIQKGDKYLLARRSISDPQAGGQWATPGGKVEMEVGEGIIESTLKREITEEIGITIADRIEYLGSDGFVRVSGHHVVGLVFLTHWQEGKAQALEDQEEVSWHTLKELNEMENLPKYLISGIRLLNHHLVT